MSQTNELEIMERIALDLERVEESLASSFNTGAEDFNALILSLIHIYYSSSSLFWWICKPWCIWSS